MDFFVYDLNATLEFRRRHRQQVRLDRKRKMSAYAARQRDNIARDIDAQMDAAIARDDQLEESKKIKVKGAKINQMSEFYIQYEESSSFSKVPASQYQGVCVEVIDHGFVTQNYPNRETGGTDTKTFRQGQFVFQLNKVDETTGKRYVMRSKKLNFSSLHEKSGLRQFLTQWRGHDLTDAEKVAPGLNIGGLVGRNALIQVVHVAGTKEGTTFANIGSIMPLMDGMSPIEALNYESQQAAVTAKTAATAAPTHSGIPTTAPADQVSADKIPF